MKELYKRLTSLGFSCWLDIEQMGGGDSLFDKIDRGVRGCKVVVSCVTTKYSKSDNCKREVSLATAVSAPIIPLKIEDVPYPPSGPMGPALTNIQPLDFTSHSGSLVNHSSFSLLIMILSKKVESQRKLGKRNSALGTQVKAIGKFKRNISKTPKSESKTPKSESKTAKSKSEEPKSETSKACILL